MGKSLSSWALLTTHGKMEFELFKHCFESWKPYYNELFTWVNNNRDTELWKYLFDNSTTVLISQTGKGRSGWIRDTPFKIAKLMNKIPRVVKYHSPTYITHFDEDELAPQHPDFPAYFQEWLKSDSEALLCEWVYFWEKPDVVRIDKITSTVPHGFFFKNKPELTWDSYYQGHGMPGTNLHNKWICPYPVGHYNKYTEEMRKTHLKHRRIEIYNLPDRERPRKWQVNPPDGILRKYDINITTEDLRNWRTEIAENKLPEGCWYE